MSSPTGSSPWSDRRGLFQKGKEVHEPGKPASAAGAVVDAVRRASVSSVEGLEKTISNTSTGGSASPTQERRRSSNAGSGLFGSLTQHKRGSEDYSQRRASHSEQTATPGGFFGGWYQSTFKGVGAKPVGDKAPSGDKKRGVME